MRGRGSHDAGNGGSSGSRWWLISMRAIAVMSQQRRPAGQRRLGQEPSIGGVGEAAVVVVHRAVLVGDHRRRQLVDVDGERTDRGDGVAQPALGDELVEARRHVVDRAAQGGGDRPVGRAGRVDVPRQRGGQPDGDRDPVGDVGERPEPVADGVGDPGATGVDGHAGEHRRLLHRPAAVEIGRLGDGAGQVVDDEADRRRGRVDHAVVDPPTGHGLDGVDHGVEPGRRRQGRRHGRGERRVEHDEPRQQLVAPRPDLATVGGRQHARAGDLRTGARRGRHGDDDRPGRQRSAPRARTAPHRRSAPPRRPPAWPCRAPTHRRCRRRRRRDGPGSPPPHRRPTLAVGSPGATTWTAGSAARPSEETHRRHPPVGDDDRVGHHDGRTSGQGRLDRSCVRSPDDVHRGATPASPRRRRLWFRHWRGGGSDAAAFRGGNHGLEAARSGAQQRRTRAPRPRRVLRPGQDQPPRLPASRRRHRPVDAVHGRRDLGVR